MKNMNDVRREDAARQGRPVRRRLLRLAVAVLRHAGAEASRARRTSTRHVAQRDGRRRLLPRQLRRRARRRQPAGRGRLVSEGRRPHDRLSRVRPRADEEARLVGRAHRRREEGGRGQELEDRPVGRHPARVHEEPRLPSVRQRQGARDRLELPRRHSAAPRAAVLAASRPRRQVSDARRQEGVLAAADAVQDRAAGEHRRRTSRRTSRWC